MAWEAYNNNKSFKDISWNELQVGDVIATKYSSGEVYHAQIVESIETRTETTGYLWWKETKEVTYITVTQGSVEGGG